MRGSPRSGKRAAVRAGIIPAHAGLTPKSCPFKCHGWDHPRACGAHILYESLIVYGLGSSPRMRGSRLASALPRTSAGIIPAHAGLTRPTAALAVAHRDHPRACGAHVRPILSLNSRWGSSPRMRGSPTCLRIAVRAGGIIPAHAGLTAVCCFLLFSCRDHPRACGAHPVSPFRCAPRPGSSPRMRGSRNVTYNRAITNGIIPAHAGLTPQARPYPHSKRDHPRACGAHPYILSAAGSSPRMRGSLFGSLCKHILKGIIPAHAGLTLTKVARILDLRDHPRACGAHVILPSNNQRRLGSSPRMRGSLRLLQGCHSLQGIIPAHAGLTTVQGRA